MSQLTSALEKLSQSIDKLETALDARLKGVDTRQKDLFSQLEKERDQNRVATRELDEIILQMEHTLTTQNSMEAQADGQ